MHSPTHVNGSQRALYREWVKMFVDRRRMVRHHQRFQIHILHLVYCMYYISKASPLPPAPFLDTGFCKLRDKKDYETAHCKTASCQAPHGAASGLLLSVAAAGSLLAAASGLLLTGGGWMLDAGCWLLAAGC